jgi:hypothetical protein
MTPDEMARRLEALQRRLNADRPAGARGPWLESVVVHGCLPPGLPLFAVSGEMEFIRGGGPGEDLLEDLDVFADRCKAAASEAGQTLLTIGGLPQSQPQMDIASLEYDLWLESDDGVPPMETGPARPSPVMRAIIDRDRPHDDR